MGWLLSLFGRPADAPWLTQMKRYVGQSCLTGSPVTPFITESFKHTTYPLGRTIPSACAAVLNRCLEECGISGTRSAAADSFRKYGEPCELREGAIIVFRWPVGDEHVTLCKKIKPETLICLGGNQGHKVQEAEYSRRYIIAIRWPCASPSVPTK